MSRDYSDTNKNYKTIVELLESGMTAWDLLYLFTNYFGLQILSKDFMEWLEHEEIL